MVASLIPVLQTTGTWTVQVGPWTLPPLAWVPATALIGGLALRVRSRQLRSPDVPPAREPGKD